MSRWEYTFVKLEFKPPWVARMSHECQLEQAMARIDQLGKEGWEAVGHVTLNWPTNDATGRRGYGDNRIMFKRPLN